VSVTLIEVSGAEGPEQRARCGVADEGQAAEGEIRRGIIKFDDGDGERHLGRESGTVSGAHSHRRGRLK